MLKAGPRSRLLPTRGGAMVVVGLIVFGLIIVGGLYVTPRATPPQPPEHVAVGAPHHKLRFVSYDLARQPPANEPMLPVIVKLDPDYVLLQDVNEDDVVEIAQFFGMQHSYHPQLYQRSEHLAGKRGTWGNVILSRQSLYQGSPLGGIRGGFGAWAASIVDDRKFFVACVHFAAGDPGVAEAKTLQEIWKSRGSPPLVAAVLPSDPKPPGGMEFLQKAAGSNGVWFYLTKEWTVVGQGEAPGAGRGLLPRWIDVVGN
jgi:hypothetical protein